MMVEEKGFRFDNDDDPIKVSYPDIWKRHWDGDANHQRLMSYWAAAWPRVFRVEDALLAFSQNKNHFKEWVAARYIAEGQTFNINGQSLGRVGLAADVLIEKYFHDRHPAKLKVFTDYCDQHGLGALKTLVRLPKDERHAQPPDLFVLPHRGLPFFVEVKGLTEGLTEGQTPFFPRIKAAAPDIPNVHMVVQPHIAGQPEWWSDL